MERAQSGLQAAVMAFPDRRRTSMMRRCRARTMKRKEGLSAGLCDQQACISFCMLAGMPSGRGGRYPLKTLKNICAQQCRQ